MKKHSRMAIVTTMVLAASWLVSCEKDENNGPVREGIEHSELIFTEVMGESVEAHGDHFHGLGSAVEGESTIVSFDEHGVATRNGHLHLAPNGVYKIELRAWDYAGNEIQQEFVGSESVAANYKAFLQGGSFILNPDSEHESGAVFQPREQQYGDNQPVNGQYDTTGILAYFTVGHDNEGPTKEVIYVLRKLDDGIKETINRLDWNRADYATQFPGTNVLELKFEIHAGEHQHH